MSGDGVTADLPDVNELPPVRIHRPEPEPEPEPQPIEPEKVAVWLRDAILSSPALDTTVADGLGMPVELVRAVRERYDTTAPGELLLVRRGAVKRSSR